MEPSRAGSSESPMAALRRFGHEERGTALALAGLTLLTLGLGVAVLDQPIRCDEAGTYLDYVRNGLRRILTDYSSPNNHILYSACARVSTALFGASEWSLRLPALIGGVLLVPAAYLAFRAHFGARAALLGAGLVATSPYLVDQATNGRGYTLLNLCFLLLLALVPRLLRSSARGPLVAFALLGGLGAWAVPVMVFPLGIVGVWMLLAILLELPRERRVPAGLRFLVACVGVGVVAGLLYAPTLLGPKEELVFTGGARFERNIVPMSRLGRLLELGRWLELFWEHVVHGLPRWVALGGLGLAVLGIGSGARRGLGLRWFLAAFLGLFGTALVAGRFPPLWSLSFLIPLYVGLAAGGTLVLGRLLLRERAGIAVAAALLLWGGAQVAAAVRSDGRQHELPWYVGYFDAEEASLVIDRDLPPASPLMGVGRQLGPVQYYQALRGDKTPGNIGRLGPLEAGEAFLIDTGLEKQERQVKGLESWGFAPTDEVIELPHSRIVRWVPVREPDPALLERLEEEPVGAPGEAE